VGVDRTLFVETTNSKGFSANATAKRKYFRPCILNQKKEIKYFFYRISDLADLKVLELTPYTEYSGSNQPRGAAGNLNVIYSKAYSE
jgi:hypothetical protein